MVFDQLPIDSILGELKKFSFSLGEEITSEMSEEPTICAIIVNKLDLARIS